MKKMKSREKREAKNLNPLTYMHKMQSNLTRLMIMMITVIIIIIMISESEAWKILLEISYSLFMAQLPHHWMININCIHSDQAIRTICPSSIQVQWSIKPCIHSPLHPCWFVFFIPHFNLPGVYTCERDVGWLKMNRTR